MRIHAPTSKPETTKVSIDVSAGAVIFDPWPFKLRRISLGPDVGFVDSTGEVWTNNPPYKLTNLGNTLVTLTDGTTAVCSEETWQEAVGQ